MNRTSERCGVSSGGLGYVNLEFQRSVRWKAICKDLLAERFPNLIKIIIRVRQKDPSTRIMTKTTPRYIISKLLKTNDKENNLQESRRNGGWVL